MGESINILIKYALALALYYSGIIPVLQKLRASLFKRRWPIVLMYHRVIRGESAAGLQPGMYVSSDSFEKQAAYLARKYNILSMSEFISGIRENRTYPGGDLLITFDDGWRDNYDNAFPILKKYRVPATIYLTTDFIGSNKSFWFQEISSLISRNKSRTRQFAEAITAVLRKHPDSEAAGKLLNDNIESALADRDQFIEKLKGLETEIIYEIIAITRKLSNNYPIQSNDERQMLDWDEVRRMSNENVDFGSHGLSHRLLDSLDSNEVAKELIESKKTIEDKLAKPAYSFTYPNGNYNREIEKQTERAGYACAFIVGKNPKAAGEPDKYTIDRIGVHNDISIGPGGKFSKAMFAFHLYRYA
jgi:peptidoglycan/xylan/chitin deacetylase (PgdA/CDA1 family)